jgi:hypothetical protein
MHYHAMMRWSDESEMMMMMMMMMRAPRAAMKGRWPAETNEVSKY